MSDTLQFELGFDVQPAINSLNQLDQEVKKSAIEMQRELAKSFGKPIEQVVQLTVDDAKGQKEAAAAAKKAADEGMKANKELQAAAKKTADANALAAKKLKNGSNAARLMKEEIKKTAEAVKVKNKQLKIAIQRMEQLKNNAGLTANQTKELSNGISAMKDKLKAQKGGFLSQVKQQIGPMAGKFAVATVAVQVAMAAVRKLASAFIELGKAMIQRTKDVQAMRLSLGAFIDDEKQIAAVMNSSKAIALTYGVALSDVDKAYRRLAPTILAAGGSLKDTEETIVALSARTVQLGLSSEKAGRYLEAVAQVMGKGKLNAEELNQQMSELDGALRSQIGSYLKSSHGVENLSEAMQNGEVTAEMFREALVAVSGGAVEKLKTEMGNLQEGFDSMNLEQFQNKVASLNTISLDSLNDTFSGIGDTIQRIIAGTAQFINSVVTGTPAMTANVKQFLDTLGILVEIVYNGLLVGFKILISTLELVYLGIRAVGDAIKKIPGISHLVDGFQRLGGFLLNQFRQGVDIILGMGEAQKTQIQLLKDEIAVLHERGEAGVLNAKEIEEAEKKVTEGIIEQLETLKEAGEAQTEIHRQRISELEEEKQIVKQNYDEIISKMNERYDAEDARLENKLSELQKAYDLEKGEITEKGSAQRKLDRLRKEELKLQAQGITVQKTSNYLAQEKQLKAQAALDRIRSQERLEKLNVKHSKDKLALEEEKDENDKAKLAFEKRMKKLRDAEITDIEKKIDLEKEGIRDIKVEYERYADFVGKSKDAEARWIEANRVLALKSINDQIRLQKELNGLKSNPDGKRAAGGPVSQGTSYQVNERGPEAFLSSSGSLEMIKAPAFGRWIAPSSGTVIPAHVTKGLNIPDGKTRVSSTPSMNAAGTGSNSSGMIRALAAISAGDSITNNVTIQSANTTQTASDVMVQLAKLKRLRYN
jgi:hypothetical protein